MDRNFARNRLLRSRAFASLLLPALLPLQIGQSLAPRPPRLHRPDAYSVDFVAGPAFGVAMNDLGDVVGTSYPDTGCGSFCLPPLETVVWRGADRIVLPDVPGLTGITVRGINDRGWVVGFAGYPYTTTHAVVWKPVGTGYQAIDLGTLAGTNTSEAIGVDNRGRVVGWSTTTNFPPNGSPFLWTETGGMIDLSAQGFPDEKPLAISPGGTVATTSAWYRLGDPASVVAIAAPPSGYSIESGPAAINDAGDQGRFLVATSGQNLVYLYRYHHPGIWQQLSPNGTGHMSNYGVGSIDADRDVTATIQSGGVIARGPDGVAQAVAPLLSPAYPGGSVTWAGAMSASGEILARVILGQSQRLVRLAPAWTCHGRCLHVESLVVTAVFVPDPNDPTHDHCSPALTAHNDAQVSLVVADSGGAPVAGAVVSGRILDDYWTDHPVTATTNAGGSVTFSYTGPCGVGAITFLVDDVSVPGWTLDRTAGVLTGWAIPH